MRRFRQLSMAIMLTLMLSSYALAGIIECPPAPAPPPEPSSTVAMGITDTPPSTVVPASDPVIDVALTLLQGALSLL